MMTRRLLITAAPLAISGCSSGFGQRFATFSGALYTDIVKVAKLLEAAVKKASVDLEGAVDDMLPYVVPVCRIIVAMDRLLTQLVVSGTLKESDKNVAAARTALGGIAGNVVVAQTAQTGAFPAASDAVTIVTGIIQVVSLAIQLTNGRVAPVAAAKA